MKTNLKILLVIAVLLITSCIFNFNIVNATEAATNEITTQNTREVQKVTPDADTLNLIDKSITLENLKEIEFRELEKPDNELKQIIMSKLEENNIDMTNYDVTLEFKFYDLSWSIRSCNVSIVQKDTREEICSKRISINYSNTPGTVIGFDMEAESICMELVNSINDPYWYYDIDKDVDVKPNYENVILDKFEQEYVKNLNSFSNTDGVEIVLFEDADSTGLWSCGKYGVMYFFKDGSLYETEYNSFSCFYEIVVPSTIADTEKAYIENALPRLKEFTSKISPDYDVSKLSLAKNTGDFYNIVDDGEVVSQIIIHKENTMMVYDGISVSSNADVTITAAPIQNDTPIYKEMQNKLTEKGYSDVFNAYELNLESGDLGNGLELTFEVGAENNGKIAIILHQKHDGSYEEFEKTVENGKVKITVTELSPFMIALKDAKVENKEDNRVLDNEPKTGVLDYTVFASVIAVISLSGLAILKFKK